MGLWHTCFGKKEIDVYTELSQNAKKNIKNLAT